MKLDTTQKARHKKAVADAAKWLNAEIERLEQEFEAKPERWQESRAGEKAADWIGDLEESATCLEEAIEAL